jgi:hypothetical protein
MYAEVHAIVSIVLTARTAAALDWHASLLPVKARENLLNMD